MTKGPPSRAHTQIGKKHTHELISHSYHGWRHCLWANTHDEGGVAQDNPANSSSAVRHAASVYSALWHCTSMLWLIDTCQTSYSLTSITWPYPGLKLRANWGQVFFWSWLQTKSWLFIGPQAHPGYLVVNRDGLFGSWLMLIQD